MDEYPNDKNAPSLLQDADVTNLGSVLNSSDSSSSLDSEKSYDTLFKTTDVFEFLTYLTFNLVWMFIATFANIILFSLYTYEFVFDNKFSFYQGVFVVIIICDVIIIIDVISAIIHLSWEKYAVLKDLPPRSKVVIFVDITSILWMVISLISKLQEIKWVAVTGIVLISLRLYRVFHFFYVISKSPGFGTYAILLGKYGLMIFIIAHIFSCLYQTMACYKCYDGPEDWTLTVIDSAIYFDGETAAKWYLVCFYFVLNAISSVGYGDIYPLADDEILVTNVLMLISFFLVAGAFLGSMTTVMVEHYRRHAAFSHRLDLISGALSHPKIGKKLRDKILRYYYLFWRQQKGIKMSYLFQHLPEPMKQQVYTDKYWHALERTYLLKDVLPAFKNAIACWMSTEVYATGETIVEQNKPMNSMIYVMRGNIQILSAEDGESPILTLGAGTCIGDCHLIHCFPSSVQVKASSYCEIQRLKKDNLWRTAVRYNRLKQSRFIHAKMERKMLNAQEKYEARLIQMSRYEQEGKEMELVLRAVKNKLDVETPKIEIYYTKEKSLDTDKTYSNLYILSLHQTTLKHSDDICLQTSWPWILQPTSVLLSIWEYYVCTCILFVSVMYPYHITFQRNFPNYMFVPMVIIDVTYCIDVVLQIFTAIEDATSIIANAADILTIRIRKPSFVLDVIAIVPLSYFASLFKATNSERILTILHVNRLVKLNRLILLFQKLGVSFHINITVVRCLKYVVYFMMLSYFFGAIFYMLACFNEICLPKSWFEYIKAQDMQTDTSRYKNAFALSIYYGALLVSQNGIGDITPKTMREIFWNSVFFIISMLLFCHLVADYTATLMLAERSRENYIETTSVIRQFMLANQMLQSIQQRTNKYLALQWRINKGYFVLKSRSVLYDAPTHLFEEQLIARRMDAVLSIPLFKALDDEHLQRLCVACKHVCLPEGEILTYAGEVIRSIYMVEQGFVELISAASGRKERVLAPGNYYGDFDMLLERPGIFHTRAVTCARVVILSYFDIKKIFIAAGVYDTLRELVAEMKSTPTVQRLLHKQSSVCYLTITEEKSASWFIFPKKKLHYLNADYEKGFETSTLWKILKVFLMRRTIIPDGSFFITWEIIQTIRIFLVGFYYFTQPILNTYTLYSMYPCIFFDIIACSDIYIRLHVCYYNKHGLLIAHPRYTAIHYLSTNFMIDFVGILPLPELLKVLSRRDRQKPMLYKIKTVLRLHKLLPLYRLTSLFSYFESRDILSSTNIYLKIAKYMPLSILFCNVLAMMLITLTCRIRENDAGYYVLTPLNDSWLIVDQDIRHFNVSEPINTYICAFFFVSSMALQEGIGNFKPYVDVEMYFIIGLAIFGYLYFTYILVLISSCKAAININLTLYQEHTKHMITFMKRETINKQLQRKVINYFGYIWQRTQGMETNKILKKCHLALQQDALLCLYEQTFLKVPVFEGMDRSFYRHLGMYMQESYLLKEFDIIRLNDIVSTIYIIHKGEVVIIAPDGSTFAVLGRGCMFGNMENAVDHRSMITVRAYTAVDLLHLNTKRFYSVTADYPVLASAIRKAAISGNMLYIGKNIINENIQETPNVEKVGAGASKFNTDYLNILMCLPVCMMFASCLSCFIVIFHVSFQTHQLGVFICTYFIDFVHVINLILGFYMPYVNKSQEIITDYKKIRKRYMTFSRFYIELLALIPLELFCLIAKKDNRLYYLSFLRINRMLRWWNLHNYFNMATGRLNVNMILFKSGAVFIYYLLLIHVSSCLLYMIACPAGKCLSSSWIVRDGKLRNNNHYLLSVYFLMSIITCTGFGDLPVGRTSEMILCFVIMLMTKFAVAIFIGDISAMVQSYSYVFGSYDYSIVTLQEYLKQNHILGPLINKIVMYVDLLWKKDRGIHFPRLLEQAPRCLREDIATAIYGKHLSQNYVFVSCHRDLIRQLTVKLKAFRFFRGDIICQQGTIDNTMYFIHKGCVSVHVSDDYEETQIELLDKMDCFGLVQGLFASVPHSRTYKAETVVIILALNLLDWVHLLRYYRAARHEIYTRIQDIIRTS